MEGSLVCDSVKADGDELTTMGAAWSPAMYVARKRSVSSCLGVREGVRVEVRDGINDAYVKLILCMTLSRLKLSSALCFQLLNLNSFTRSASIAFVSYILCTMLSSRVAEAREGKKTVSQPLLIFHISLTCRRSTLG